MSRPASERTLAIRKLFVETNGEITYSEARERLPALGHKVPRHGSPKYLKDMNKFNVTKAKWKLSHLGKDSQKPQDRKVKVAASADKPHVTRRPKYGKANKAVKLVPKHRKLAKVGTTAVSDMAALQYVTTHGGVVACQKRAEELRTEAGQIDANVNTVLALHKQLAKAVA